MNFFGHSVVASAAGAQPLFVLGAMLPDFETMVVQPAPAFTDASVERGREFHHATDRAFHTSRQFLEHQGAARTWLRSTCLGSGQRRAVAHVGVELILDSALSQEPRMNAYRLAIASGLKLLAESDLCRSSRARFGELLTRLLARGSAVVAQEPADVAHRLQRILSSRPALRLEASHLPLVAAWAQTAWEPIHAEATDWLEGLLRALSEPDAQT